MKVVLWIDEDEILNSWAITKHGHDVSALHWLEDFNVAITLRWFGGDCH
jgi:hypothetical protein